MDPLQVHVVRITEPVLGRVTASGGGAVAFRFAIPFFYDPANEVTMRLFLHRTGPRVDDCTVLDITAKRLRDGTTAALYGNTRWVRIDVDDLMIDSPAEGALVTVDMPLNSPAGLGWPADLLPGDFLVFEILTLRSDGGDYQVVGVEFFESSPGESATRRAEIFFTVPADACLNHGP